MVGHMYLRASENNWEPKELLTLKRQLANLNCKCSLCNKSKNHIKFTTKSFDKGVQYEQGELMFFSTRQIPVTFTESMNNCYYNSLFAKCLSPADMARKKIFKDEGSETTPENFRCDKSTGYTIIVSEKSTSATNKQHPNDSNLALCDFITVCSNCSIENNEYEQNFKEKGQEKMKCMNNQNEELDAHKFSIYNGDCLSLDNFIDLIRPPLTSVPQM